MVVNNKIMHFLYSVLLVCLTGIELYALPKENCSLSQDLIQEIKGYAPLVHQIIDKAVRGAFKGFVYKELAQFVDTYEHRVPGSDDLNNGVRYMLKKLHNYKLHNVHGEEINIPMWIRGEESATLVKPFKKKLNILGLGYSVGTPPEGIVADAVVVSSFQELNDLGEKVRGKIVVMNEEFVSYEETIEYRVFTSSRAAAYGAMAVLVRSVTPFSLNTPHTGGQLLSDTVKNIPAACITVEDAHLLERLSKRNVSLVISIKMEAHTLSDTKSENIVAEIEGNEVPREVVIVSGHLDSWDVGQGASDDGGGSFISWISLVLLKSMNLTARRTIRLILWSAEEEGFIGAKQYAKIHADETKYYNLLMESDEGTGNPRGFRFGGSDRAACILEEILKLLAPLHSSALVKSKYVGSDIEVWSNTSVPRASLMSNDDTYFWYHHTNADTMEVLNSNALDECLAVWASVAFVAANISASLINDV